MANEKIEKIREMAIHQLEALQEIAGADLKGTDLELDLRMALMSLNKTKSSSAKVSTEATIVAETIVQGDSIYNDEYDDNYDEEYDYEAYEDDFEQDEPAVPQNFENEENYQDFLRTQEMSLPTVTDEETGEESFVRPDDVAGVIATDEGYVEVGNLDESLAQSEEILREQNTIRDDEGNELYQNEVNEVPVMRIAFTRVDESALTEHQLRNVIFPHPQSRTMLETFGNDYRIVDGDTDAEKIALFTVDNTNERSRRASQGIHYSNGVVQFSGHLTFPGVGLVYARALV